MLKELMKALGKGEAPAAEVPETTETLADAVSPELVALQAEFDLFKETSDDLLAVAGEEIAQLTAKLNEVTIALEVANGALSLVNAEKEAVEAAALVAKATARKEKVEAAIGTEKAAGLLLATEGLDDAAFDAVVSALAGSVEAEASADLFTEVGVTAEADATKIAEESAEMKILKQKYQPKSK